ncbi:hypothetical protein GCHA_3679 [Paraglaciecola chathamensis S18K6]|uniref:Uncharacterized protein n=1 Tax=Paraglaciecola chathamensis S18K6 TaxID=1127672 RepID=A0AAV3V4I4_9ALTE|nr:hypothetical protein GCHA_3679 [Paraglaciecola chathamensis S18K6]
MGAECALKPVVSNNIVAACDTSDFSEMKRVSVLIIGMVYP